MSFFSIFQTIVVNTDGFNRWINYNNLLLLILILESRHVLVNCFDGYM